MLLIPAEQVKGP